MCSLQYRTLCIHVSIPAPYPTSALVRMLYFISYRFMSARLMFHSFILLRSTLQPNFLPLPECGKGFRYKVSQRSHKCSGVLVKQPGELLQKLMQNSSILPPSTITSSTVTNETANANVEISISNTTQHVSHELCLDDLLKDDSYERLMKSGVNESQLIPQLSGNAFDDNTNAMSFNNMTINANYGVAGLLNSHNNNNNAFNMNFPTSLETINEDSIKELLGALR